MFNFFGRQGNPNAIPGPSAVPNSGAGQEPDANRKKRSFLNFNYIFAATLAVCALVFANYTPRFFKLSKNVDKMDYSTYPFKRDEVAIENYGINSESAWNCSDMYTGHLRDNIPVEKGGSLVIYGEKGVGKSHLSRCSISPNDKRILVELTSKTEFESLLQTYDFQFKWTNICHIVLLKLAKVLADFAAENDAKPFAKSSSVLKATDHVEAYNMLFQMAELLNIDTAKRNFLKFFAELLYGIEVPASIETASDLLGFVTEKMNVPGNPPSVHSLTEHELKNLLIYVSLICKTHLKLTMTIMVDGIDEIGYLQPGRDGISSAKRKGLKRKLVENLLMHFFDMATSKQISIMYFLPKTDVDYEQVKSKVVDPGQLKKLQPFEVSWTHEQIWRCMQMRYDKWIAELHDNHKRRGHFLLPQYPSFREFLLLDNKEVRTYLEGIPRTPRDFLLFLGVLGNHIYPDLPTAKTIKESICKGKCTSLQKDRKCDADAPSFCHEISLWYTVLNVLLSTVVVGACFFGCLVALIRIKVLRAPLPMELLHLAGAQLFLYFVLVSYRWLPGVLTQATACFPPVILFVLSCLLVPILLKKP